MTGPPPPTDADRLRAERYGLRQPSHRRRLVVVIAVVAVSALAWLLWAAWSAADPEVEAEVLGWEVVSANRVEVELVVHRDHDLAVVCTLAAQAEDASIVGEAEVSIPAGDPGEQQVETVITTERGAAAVRLLGCE